MFGLASALFKDCQNICQEKVRDGNAYLLLDHLELPPGCYSFSLCCAVCLTWPLLLPMEIVSLSEGRSSHQQSPDHPHCFSVTPKAVKKSFVALLALAFCFHSSDASYCVVILFVI